MYHLLDFLRNSAACKILRLCSFLLLLVSCGGSERNGSYIIGVDIAWHDSEFLGEQNSITGFSRDLLKEISKNQKMKLAFVPVNWDILIPNLKTGHYNGIFSSIYPYIFNQTIYDFSEPFILTGPVLVVPAVSTISSLEELNGQEIASFADINGELVLEKNPAILIRPYDSIPQALNDVVAGNIDGALLDVIIASAYCRNLYQGMLKIATSPPKDQGLRLLTQVHKAPQLIDAFNAGLHELKKNGTYDTLLAKWSIGQGPSPPPKKK